MIDALEFAVRGKPSPQGSKRTFINPKTKKIVTMEDSPHVKTWRDDVRTAAVDAAADADWPLGYRGPVLLTLVFSFGRPKTHFGSGRNAAVLKESAPPRPHGDPDLDKLARACGDALQSAGIFYDDNRIVEYERLAKVWCMTLGYGPEINDVDALSVPGCWIRVVPL